MSPVSWSCSVAASMMARFMPQTQFGVVAGQRVEGWAVGSAGRWTQSCSRRAPSAVCRHRRRRPGRLVAGPRLQARPFCMPSLSRSGHRQQPGYPVGMAPRFPRFRRAYVTVPEYGRAVVDVSGSAARLAAPVARPRAATIRRGGIRWRPRRGCCAPRGSSVG